LELDHGKIGQEPVVEVAVSSLLSADSPRISGESPEHVETLAAAQNELPPIIVHRATMRVIDGLHRLKAAKLRGETKIAARFFDGDADEAFVLAVRSNIAHGLPLSLADRKRATERIIASHPQWSDRKVASVVGIAPGTVAEIRKRILGTSAFANSRIGQDGRVRPIDSTEGRRLAGELITEDPSLSLRQIARAAGISPETARDVKNRLRRGEDPLPKQRNNGRRLARPRTDPGYDNRHGRASVQERAAAVERLRADPALRFSATGRNLLMLLNIHTIKAEEWDEIIDNVPPHCFVIIAKLARDSAELWAEFAGRVEHQVANINSSTSGF
jgi:ParB-like chromosome segregation protein Spo0J